MAYLAPIHRPSSVRHAIQLSFLSEGSLDLVVAKANRLEIYSPDDSEQSQLVLRHSKAIYGRVTLLERLKPATSRTDHLFVGTDRFHYFTVSWDAERRTLKTEKAFVDIAEKAARDSQTGDRIHVDPTSRYLSLECYEGVVNILPIHQESKGKGKKRIVEGEIGEIGEPVSVRIPELYVRSSCFVYNRGVGTKLPSPELAFLYEDGQNRVRLKVRKLDYTPSLKPNEEPASAELEQGKDGSGDLELGASHLIPLPPPVYGLLVVGETRISYVDEWNYEVKDTRALEEATVFVAWCDVGDMRYVLADDYGKLYLLMVYRNDVTNEYDGHQIDLLGETSRASTLVYLDGGRVFVGSHQGDSQIIQIISANKIEVVQTFSNVAPILDFTVMDMGNRTADAPVNEFSSGQARIVTGSGAYKDGSLRSVRSGVGLEDRGTIADMGGLVSSVFGLSSGAPIEHPDTLVVSFVSRTRVFHFDDEGEVEEVDNFRGMDLSSPTVFAGNLADGRIVSISSTSVTLVDTSRVIASWSPPQDKSITAASESSNKILISLGGAALIVLDVAGDTIQVQAQKELNRDEQVSCITLSGAIPNLGVVGSWQGSRVSYLDLQTLAPVATEVVVEDESVAVPRSLVVANILPNQPATLFIGLADGNVVTYSIESPQRPFAARKSIILGTQQANFALLPRSDGLQNVFATCEHASLIYGSDGRVVYSAITAEAATSICSFNNSHFPGSIAVIANNELKLAVVDEERTTHVQTLPVNATVRRIAYSADSKAFGLGTIKRILEDGVEKVESRFALVDEIAFQELHSFSDLHEDELIECCMRCKLDDGSGSEAERFVVGTAFLDDQDSSTTRGRILVFEVTESRQLKLITEHGLKGACRCLGMVQGKIVAALVKTVVIFSFEYQTPSTPFLVKRAVYRAATAPIDICITENTIAVTDLMKSVSLLEYQQGSAGMADTLFEIARHYETVWGTAVARVGEGIYLSADAEGNLVVLQHDMHSAVPEDRKRLRPISEILLGEMVNRIRPVAITATTGAAIVPRAFLATVEGSIYLYATINETRVDLLIRMQDRMAELIKSPGHVPFTKFRGFKSSVRDAGDVGPSRFVDGDLIEAYLDCPVDVQENIAQRLAEELKISIGAEDLRGLVEELRRTH
nr:dna damage-binding protein 1 [Quercus suber]